ncbi:MAG: cisplatin damage response ATP-dependent DNA ligase [Pseudomonadota bacterium]
MKAFATLLDRLAFTPGRNGKLKLMADYFAGEGDPARGYGLAALTGELAFTGAKPALIRAIVETRVDPVLFAWSYDFVGDLAETAALIWPSRPGANRPPELPEVVTRLARAGRSEVPGLLEGWLDGLDATGRWALLKLITGGLRVGVSARLAKTALARLGDQPVAEIEEVWHGLQPPYEDLFAWLEGRAPRPTVDPRRAFRPLMLAQPLEESELAALAPDQFRAEWKWDGIRVQLSAGPASRRLFSRSGDDIGGAFPDILEAANFDGVLDGELLVLRDGQVAPFNDLQQRLNRKTVSAKLLAKHPAHIRLYDLLFEGPEDLRPLSFALRRARLEAWYDNTKPARMDLSAEIPFASWEELAALRAGARAGGIEGLMVKRADSPYLAGRPKGHWFKWKRDALTADCVLMYAQRGHGKRSSFYSDYTFGAWRDGEGGDELVPVGKAYFGFTDEELKQLDKWVRDNTTERFGPVRAVAPGLVLEVAFDAVQRSARHKSGLALRFPRIHRIRWDKPVAEAERVETLAGWIEG